MQLHRSTIQPTLFFLELMTLQTHERNRSASPARDFPSLVEVVNLGSFLYLDSLVAVVVERRQLRQEFNLLVPDLK